MRSNASTNGERCGNSLTGSMRTASPIDRKRLVTTRLPTRRAAGLEVVGCIVDTKRAAISRRSEPRVGTRPLRRGLRPVDELHQHFSGPLRMSHQTRVRGPNDLDELAVRQSRDSCASRPRWKI